jgi:hypothetical protein
VRHHAAMAYVRNPVYLGVGAVDRVDRDAGLVRNAAFDSQFKKAFFSLMRMPADARAKFMREVQDAVSTLPGSQRQQINTMAKAAERIDPRKVPLGALEAAATAANAVHWTTQVANIAGVVASLATVGFGVANFIESRKASKEEADRLDKQQAMQQQQMNADLAERQQRLDAAKAQTASIQAQQAEEARLKQLNESGYTVAPDGSVVPKPKSSAGTIGAIAAAAVGAFFMAK